MYAPERHQAILDAAREAGRAEVSALADLLDVTPETIRRDLTVLERRGVLRRVHGGAIPVERLGAELAVPERQDVAAAGKQSINCARMAHPEGLEPPTPRFVVWCSIQLSYGCRGPGCSPGGRGSQPPKPRRSAPGSAPAASLPGRLAGPRVPGRRRRPCPWSSRRPASPG